MMTGLSARVKNTSYSRKTAVINDELRRLNVDIATLQETQLADCGTLKEKDYTFFWQGRSSDEPREHEVGFAVRNNLLRMVEPGNVGSEDLLTLRLNSATGPVTLISVYAPTLSATPDMFTRTFIHYQEHPQQETSCCSGWLRCQSGCRSQLVALLPWSVRTG